MDEEIARALENGTSRNLAHARAEQDRGLSRVGWKISAALPALRQRLGLDGWTVSALTAGGSLDEPVFTLTENRRIYLEAGIAVRLGTSLPADVSAEEAAESIEGFAPAVEFLDFSLGSDDLEEIASHGFFHAASWIGGALGGFHELAPDHPVILRDGEAVTAPSPELALNDPTALIRGAASLLDRYDERFDGGDWLLCGPLVHPTPCNVGEHLEIDFGPMGKLSVVIEAG